MVKSGKFTVNQPSIFGRLGTGVGKGLAEQLPKEMERGRLAAGLQQFEKESGNLTPLQQYTRLIPMLSGSPHGAQALQAIPEVLKQQNFAKAFSEQNQPANQVDQSSSFSVPMEEDTQPSSGLATRPGIEATRRPYIPKTYQQILDRASQLFNANRALYNNDPNKAIDAARQEETQKQAINSAYQNQRAGEQTIQRAVQSNLETQAKLLNAKVPPDVYSDIEQKAVRSVLPVEEGGEGLTDEEAKIKYGNELDTVSRQYNDLRNVGNWTLPFQKPSEALRQLKTIRKGFKDRNDLRNLADSYISENGLSPGKAYSLAYPNSEIPELSKTLKKIPDVSPSTSFKSGKFEKKETDYNPTAILNQIIPKLAKDMGKDGSPLAVAEDLESKGYDSSLWFNYLDQNRDKLDLTQRQVSELSKPRNFFPTMSDIWLFKLIGQDNLVD